MLTRMLSHPTRRTVLASVVAAPVLSACGARSWDEFEPTELAIGTGNPGGVFHRYGEALSTVWEQRLAGITVHSRRTNASVDNIREVSQGDSDIGFSLADAAGDASRGRGEWDEPVDLVALARAYDSFVHLVVRADSSIHEVGDLAGRRVSLGASGSGTRVTARRILRAADILESDVEAVAETLQRSADALAAGRLDAFFFVSGLPNTAVLRLAERTAIRLVPLGGVVPQLAREHGGEFTRSSIPASTYGLARAADTVSVQNYVLVRRDLDEALVYALTRVMFEAQPAVEALARGLRQPNLGTAIYTSPLPLHAGALRYYREQR